MHIASQPTLETPSLEELPKMTAPEHGLHACLHIYTFSGQKASPKM
jgi:hypothetical protein